MSRVSGRGGRETRDRIATVASGLFAERGFEDVTVAEVGRTAGVSAVTVFKYFPKKEDLFFDRADEISDLLVDTIGHHTTRVAVLVALESLLEDTIDHRHPISGLDERSVGFFRTVVSSPTLIARARQIAAEVQQRMSRHLAEGGYDGDSAFTAAFFIAGYIVCFTETVTDLLAGVSGPTLTNRHRSRVEHLLRHLQTGIL